MAKNKEEKTNVMRTLDQKKIPYTAPQLRPGRPHRRRVRGADIWARTPEQVFKTLVTKGASGGILCVRHPGGREPGPEKGRQGGGGEVRGHAASEGAAAPDRLCPRRMQPGGHEKAVPHGVPRDGGSCIGAICVSAGKIGHQVECDPNGPHRPAAGAKRLT